MADLVRVIGIEKLVGFGVDVFAGLAEFVGLAELAILFVSVLFAEAVVGFVDLLVEVKLAVLFTLSEPVEP